MVDAMSLGVLGFLAALIIPLIIIGIAIYIYSAIVLMTIARKTKTENAWLAWIPIGNIYLMTQIAEVPSWWTFLILAGIIPFLGAFVVGGLVVFLWWKIAENLGKPGWYGVLMLIPIVNLIVMGMLAWGE